MLKSSQNFKKKGQIMPTMDLSKLKKNSTRRNYVAVNNTQRRPKEKDLLFLEKEFIGSSQSMKKSFVEKVKRLE